MIFALAGRRIDKPDAGAVRFPLRSVELVRGRLRTLFEEHPRATLICSAACGADLLALETAGALEWRRYVILPYDRDRFRETSVTDRPGNWGPLYDRILDEVGGAGGLRIETPPDSKEPFRFVTGRILEEAAHLAGISVQEQAAVAVWDGHDRGAGDLVSAFVSAARERGVTVHYLSTLP